MRWLALALLLVTSRAHAWTTKELREIEPVLRAAVEHAELAPSDRAEALQHVGPYFPGSKPPLFGAWSLLREDGALILRYTALMHEDFRVFFVVPIKRTKHGWVTEPLSTKHVHRWRR